MNEKNCKQTVISQIIADMIDLPMEARERLKLALTFRLSNYDVVAHETLPSVSTYDNENVMKQFATAKLAENRETGTIKIYLYLIRNFFDQTHLLWSKVTGEDVAAYLATRKVKDHISDSYLVSIQKALCVFYGWLFQRKYMAVPEISLTLPGMRKERIDLRSFFFPFPRFHSLLNSSLTDGIGGTSDTFRFGTDGAGNYGYIKKVSGADTFFPFKSGYTTFIANAIGAGGWNVRVYDLDNDDVVTVSIDDTRDFTFPQENGVINRTSRISYASGIITSTVIKAGYFISDTFDITYYAAGATIADWRKYLVYLGETNPFS